MLLKLMKLHNVYVVNIEIDRSIRRRRKNLNFPPEKGLCNYHDPFSVKSLHSVFVIKNLIKIKRSKYIMNIKKDEIYEKVHEGIDYRVATDLLPQRYKESDIVKVIIDGKECGYKMIPKPCRVDPKEFPIFDPNQVCDEYFWADEMWGWIEKTIKINEADIDLKAYVKDDFIEMEDKIYIRLCLNDEFPDEIPSRDFQIFKIIYEIEIFIDGLRMRVPVDYDMVKRWGISLQELDQIAMDNSIRDYPPILRTWNDLGKGQYNLLLGDIPDTTDKSYVLTNPNSYHSVSALAYPGVLEKIAEIFDDDFVFLSKNSNYVMLAPLNKKFDHWFITLERKNPENVSGEDYFSRYAYDYFRETKEIVLE